MSGRPCRSRSPIANPAAVALPSPNRTVVKRRADALLSRPFVAVPFHFVIVLQAGSWSPSRSSRGNTWGEGLDGFRRGSDSHAARAALVHATGHGAHFHGRGSKSRA